MDQAKTLKQAHATVAKFRRGSGIALEASDFYYELVMSMCIQRKTFKVTALNAKERTRVAEHGNLWEATGMRHRKSNTMLLLESAKSRHLRWWPKAQVESYNATRI